MALLCAAALASIVAAAPDASAGGTAALRPDLVTLEISGRDVRLERDDDKTLLRFSNEVANRGDGPLEVFPSAASTGCDGDADPENDRDASQRLFADSDGSGGFERGVDGVDAETPFGCMRFHPAHNHWHVLNFTDYELRREPGGKLAASRTKLGFCLGDNRQAFPGPRSPEPAYPFGPPGSVGCDSSSTQGVSVGYADLYAYKIPGQVLDVTDLSAGRYCLISHADPTDLLDETDEENNIRRARVSLRPREFFLRRLEGRCRI